MMLIVTILPLTIIDTFITDHGVMLQIVCPIKIRLEKVKFYKVSQIDCSSQVIRF